MKIKTLRDLFEVKLRYAYDCEQKLVKKGLPTMIELASSSELRNALQHHLEQTREHVTRLEEVFAFAGTEAETKGNDVFDKMASAAKDNEDIESPSLRDAALISSGNEVEHYEIALYGSLAAWAQQLGLQDAANLLRQTLQEEKDADAKLTALGESSINPQAAQERRAA
jgi:ferritin-like metal-binding protein YciE